MTGTLRIIRPAARERQDFLPARIAELEAAGYRVLFDDLPPPKAGEWAYAASSAEARARQLQDALLEPGVDAVLAARGGYGASDLLPLLDWERLAKAKPKLLCGFSDICALMAALDGRLGWPSLHGPMPATSLWQSLADPDVQALLEIVRGFASGEPLRGRIVAKPLSKSDATFEGKLFGGCFSVLTNLIGTPYFPASLAGRIIFLEDTDESPARLMRMWNQWIQSGVLRGASAVVLGYLRKLGDGIADCAPYVYQEFQRRSPIPVFASADFGHCAPNRPLLLGAEARLERGLLSWSFKGSNA